MYVHIVYSKYIDGLLILNNMNIILRIEVKTIYNFLVDKIFVATIYSPKNYFQGFSNFRIYNFQNVDTAYTKVVFLNAI
jgi:hypothetical protein